MITDIETVSNGSDEPRDDGSLAYKRSQLKLTPEQQYMTDLAVANTDSISKTFQGNSPVETTNSEALDVAFSKFNTVALASDRMELADARAYGKDVDVDESVYTAGIPAKYLPMIQEEASQRGSYAAQMLGKQLLEDIEDDRLFDNLAWYEQLGYGGLAMIVDPLTVATGAGVKVAQASTFGMKLGAKSQAIQAIAKPWQATGVKYGTSATKWGTAGAVEESIAGAVRLDADHTYTVKDLQMDIMAGFVLGGVLAPLAKAVKAGVTPAITKANRASRKMHAEFDSTKANKAKKETQGKTFSSEMVGDFEVSTNVPTSTHAKLKAQYDAEVAAEKEQFRNNEEVQAAVSAKMDAWLERNPDATGEQISQTIWITEDVEIDHWLRNNHQQSKTTTTLNGVTTVVESPVGTPSKTREQAPTSPRINATQIIGGLDAVKRVVMNEAGEQVDPDHFYKKHLEQSASGLYSQIEGFSGSAEQLALNDALKGNIGSKAISLQWAGNIFTDTATRFQNSKVDSLQWFGLNATESGKGFGGKVNRKATAGLMKRMIADRSLGKVLPAYTGYIDQYAASKGKGAWSKLNAQQMDGKSNPLVKQFHEETFIYMENMRLGKEVGEVSDSVKMFSDEWNGYMAHNHKELVKDVKGFTAERQRKNYIPRISSPSKMKSMEKAIGKNGVLKLLRSAFEEVDVRTGVKAGDEGFVPTNTRAAAYFKSIEDQKWAGSKGKNVDLVDEYSPLQDAASRERIDFDITHSVHIDGKDYRIMDLLNTELPEIATKYSERTSGFIGLSKATGGAISSPVDIQVMRSIIKKESVDKGLSTGEVNKNLSMFDDVIDQLLGRPAKFFQTEGIIGRAERAITGTNMVGLPEEFRQLKDATALAQLGGLGSAQLAEIGDVVQRTIMNAWDNKKAVDGLLSDAGVDIANKADRDAALREITEHTGLIREMEWLDRQAVHIDQGDLEHIGKLRAASLEIADTMTFGKHKASASRLLSKVTGFNLIRRKQFEVAQSSTATAIARKLNGMDTSLNGARLRDLGLDTPEMTAAMKNVEFSSDNQVLTFNFHKWDDEVLDTFIYGIYRDATQSVQRTLVGERPAWLNRPMMQLLTQYLEMPIVAMNKKLGRQVQFADKEAALNMAVLSAMGGLTKYAYEEASDLMTGAGKDAEIKDFKSLTESDGFQAMKYTPVLGFMPDVLEWIADPQVPNIPVLAMMKNYGEAGMAAKDVATGDGSAKDFVDTAARLAPLSTTIYAKGLARLNEEMTQ